MNVEHVHTSLYVCLLDVYALFLLTWRVLQSDG